MAKNRLFILESTNAIDLLEGREESATLVTACRVIGYEVATFVIRSKVEFETTCRYIAAIHPQSKKSQPPLFIHVSAHGNEKELGFGPDDLSWKDLAAVLSCFCKERSYNGPIVLVVSACGAGNQKITSALKRAFAKEESYTPFEYVFVTNDAEVIWADALVAWTLFYHQIKKNGIEDHAEIRRALKTIADATGANLKYFRWDNAKSEYRFPLKVAAK